MESRDWFALVLRASGVFILGAGAMHVVLGLQADALLGANVSAQSLTDPALDSQNRFYGAAFTLCGVLLLTISRNLRRYGDILNQLLWVFWGAGWVRFISVALYGVPPLLVALLFAAEILLPPLLMWWHRRVREDSGSAAAPS